MIIKRHCRESFSLSSEYAYKQSDLYEISKGFYFEMLKVRYCKSVENINKSSMSLMISNNIISL